MSQMQGRDAHCRAVSPAQCSGRRRRSPRLMSRFEKTGGCLGPDCVPCVQITETGSRAAAHRLFWQTATPDSWLRPPLGNSALATREFWMPITPSLELHSCGEERFKGNVSKETVFVAVLSDFHLDERTLAAAFGFGLPKGELKMKGGQGPRVSSSSPGDRLCREKLFSCLCFLPPLVDECGRGCGQCRPAVSLPPPPALRAPDSCMCTSASGSHGPDASVSEAKSSATQGQLFIHKLFA